MDSYFKEPIIETEYLLSNAAYIFKLTRVSRRLSISAASDLLKMSGQAICETENRKVKRGIVDTLMRMQKGYGLDFYLVFRPYTSHPTAAEIEEVNKKAIELGIELHCKDIPLPGSCRAAKPYDEAWAEWGKATLDRFNERVGKKM